jgi:hypothetical protein
MKIRAVIAILSAIVFAVVTAGCGSKDPVTPPGDGGNGGPTVVTLDLEDLTVGQRINVGSIYRSGGINIVIEQFQWSNMTWTSGGWADVQTSPTPGGSGKNIWTNNVNLNFELPFPVSAIAFKCQDWGGNCNFKVNGVHRNIEDLATLNGQTIGGVLVAIVGTGGNPLVVTLTGNITEFKLGGQEFAIDDIAYTYTP